MGFRAYVVRLAQELGIRGQVWNTHDEAVEIDAGHDDAEVLNSFSERLHDGPGRVGVILQSDMDFEIEPNFWIAETK